MNVAKQSPRQPRNLVASVAERLRELVFRGEPDDRIGSLTEIAEQLGVGIVTVQQAARVLEHEGLLVVRRGPGGGYFGRRPDDESLERSLAAYMRMHPDSIGEALDITSLLFIELCGAAAGNGEQRWLGDLERLAVDFATCGETADLGPLEERLQDLLFRMVNRPIFELLTRVTLRFAAQSGRARLHDHSDGLRSWIEGRRRIITAIIASDEPLARFEADRSNRQAVLTALRAGRVR